MNECIIQIYYVYSVRTTREREREREMGRFQDRFCIWDSQIIGGDALLHDFLPPLA